MRYRVDATLDPGTGKFSQAAKPSPAQIAAERNRISLLPRHLIDCNIRVYALPEDDSQRLWNEMVRQALASKCKSISIFNCASGTEILPTSLIGKAVDAAKGKDIAIIMFYYIVQVNMNEFVRRLREANPNLYVVIVSGTTAPDIKVGKGLADLVIDKNQLSREQVDATAPWFANHLTTMLANASLGSK